MRQFLYVNLEELILVYVLNAKHLMVDDLLNKEIYFGFKFHELTIVYGFLTDYVITPANIDDRSEVWDLCDGYNSIPIIDDKWYVSKMLTHELKSKMYINLIFLIIGNSKGNC